MLSILPESPNRPSLTSSFLAFSQSHVSEPPSQFSAQFNPITATTSFDSQNIDLRPILDGPSCQEDAASLKDRFEDPQELEFNEDQESAEDSDNESVDKLLEGLLTESKSTNSDVERVWETAEVRAQNECFREYASRRAQAFGYENLREQQLEALEELIEHRRDVMLIAKTSFGKSLIFQLAPLLMPKPTKPGIALILMPLTLLQQNQSAVVYCF